eukprot:1368284-Prorocentrum_lima.AAC.1
MKSQTELKLDGVSCFFSSSIKGNLGVGLLVHDDISHLVQSVVPVGPRLIWMTLLLPSMEKLGVACCHAPHEGCDKSDKLEFFQHAQTDGP